jgi:hypothetical protein
MKRFKIVVAMILMIIPLVRCATLHHTSDRNVPANIRRILVGTWEGKHLDHEGKLLRTWIQNRSEDGSYTIDFFHHTEKGVFHSTQEGKWWIDGNRFYEIAPNAMEKPDVYQFKILDEDDIHFRSMKDDYEFTDRRIEDFRQGQGVWL